MSSALGFKKTGRSFFILRGGKTLPALAGADAIWFAMPITELLTAIYVVVNMRRYTKQLPTEQFETERTMLA